MGATTHTGDDRRDGFARQGIEIAGDHKRIPVERRPGGQRRKRCDLNFGCLDLNRHLAIGHQTYLSNPVRVTSVGKFVRPCIAACIPLEIAKRHKTTGPHRDQRRLHPLVPEIVHVFHEVIDEL